MCSIKPQPTSAKPCCQAYYEIVDRCYNFTVCLAILWCTVLPE